MHKQMLRNASHHLRRCASRYVRCSARSITECPFRSLIPLRHEHWTRRRTFHQTHIPRAASKESSGFGVEEATIYALSTAAGRAGIAIVRISGPACIDVCITFHEVKAGLNMLSRSIKLFVHKSLPRSLDSQP